MSFEDLKSHHSEATAQALASGVFSINASVSTFHRLVNAVGTPKDTPELRSKLHKKRVHIEEMMKDTSAKLKQADEAVHQAETSATKKIIHSKLARSFIGVLKDFQGAQRLLAEKETTYTPFVSDATLPSGRKEIMLNENDLILDEAPWDEEQEVEQYIHQQVDEINGIFKDLAVLAEEQHPDHIINYPKTEEYDGILKEFEQKLSKLKDLVQTSGATTAVRVRPLGRPHNKICFCCFL